MGVRKKRKIDKRKVIKFIIKIIGIILFYLILSSMLVYGFLQNTIY